MRCTSPHPSGATQKPAVAARAHTAPLTICFSGRRPLNLFGSATTAASPFICFASQMLTEQLICAGS